ncbi:MAG: aldehyde dehydrogenase family protein, partial [Minisyncoccales bacterium]
MSLSTIPVWSPATELQIGEVAAWGEAQLTQAIAAAQAAQRQWIRLPLAERQAFLMRIADTVDAHAEELAMLESSDVGKPIRAARAEVAGVAACFRYYAGALDKVHGDTITLDDGISFT